MGNTVKGTPKDVFSHLASFVALYVSTFSFLSLVFSYVEHYFPDALNMGYVNILDSVRWTVAILIVVWPVFILMSWLISREFKKNPERREVRIRKWLVYLTLFVSAATMIVDVVTLIYNFLGGEITTQFVLKVVAVLIVAAAVFGYYLWDLKVDITLGSRLPKLFVWVVTVIVLAAVILGFVVVGSPKTQRDRKFDELRINDLSMIQNEVINYWVKKKELPKTLDNLKDDITGFRAPVDPETSVQYVYSAKDKLSFELCADFNTEIDYANSKDGAGVSYPAYYSPYGYSAYNDNWSHTADHACFTRTIDPDNYKQFGVPIPSKLD